MPTVTTRLGVLAAALLAAAGAARAQEAAPGAIEDPRAARFADVERGFFVGMETGFLTLLRTPAVDLVRFPAARGGGGRSMGLDIDVLVGRDLTSRLALSLFASGTSQSARSSYGAFDLLAAGLDARYAFYALKDRNGWERFFVYGHLRGGYLATHPRGLFGTTDTLVAGGLGADYYTQLRHFAVGLRIDGLYVLSAGAPGLAITPTVRYTF